MSASLLASALLLHLAAAQSGFSELGQDLRPREHLGIELNGYLRLRGEALGNLDLDRGPTPSGRPLFPVPLADPTAQTLTHGDMRLRTDLAIHAPGGSVAVKMRADVFDNLSLGSTPDGPPAFALGQRSPSQALSLKRVWGEALTPIGLLAAGRMGSQWGLGMLANGGDCPDCDGGDAADRIAFVTPIAGHVWAAAYDISAIGPQVPRAQGGRVIDVEPSADVRTATFAVLRIRSNDALTRRRLAGKSTVEYGAYVSHRWQNRDVPSAYLPTASPVPLGSGQVIARGYRATALDGWFRLTLPGLRLEAEAAVLVATIDQASLLPGALFNQPVRSRQFGGALVSETGAPEDRFGVGLDTGFASGDPSPGFGATLDPNAPAPRKGDLDGPQATPPFDNRADNFRFHPDFRVDRILFREIIGTVTDALYLRPHLRWRALDVGPGALTASLAVIASRAVFASSTPGGAAPLGVELDPSLTWVSQDGFTATLDHAILFPLSGLDNPSLGLPAKPAQLLRLRLAYVF